MSLRTSRETVVTRCGRVVVERRRIDGERCALPPAVQARKAKRARGAEAGMSIFPTTIEAAEMNTRPLAADLARILAGAPLRFPAVLFGRVL